MTAPTEVRITLPVWQRVFVTAFGLLWLGAVGTGFVLGLRDSNAPIPLIFMFLFGVFAFGAALRPELVARGDQVAVRNAFKTVIMARSEIAEFRIGRGSGRAGSQSILIVPYEGEVVSVDVTRRLRVGKSERFSTHLAALTAWHAR